ncbi:hypothetical protein EDB89DRAFT_2157637 [Lactarius sanguifluus]|nr:hypothetical protein EDB89DRAFT_2157637 [Lactarius sanguifluus]
MSAQRQSARNKARQAVESETPSVPDSRKTPAAERHQPAKGKPTSKARRGAPKVKLVAKSTDLTAGSDAEMESEPDNPSPARSVPHKRSLPKSRDTGEDPATQIVKPVGKKPKVGVCTVPENPHVKIKKPIPPRSPLPQRTNHMVQPAKPDMPRPKHTLAQVAAAEAEKVNLLWRLEELEKEKKLALAELGLNEEAQDAVEERKFVRHFKDLPDVDKDSESEKSPAGPKDDALEAFPVDKDEPLVSQDGEDKALRPEDPFLELETMPATESGAAAGVVKKKKKPAKGETRKAIEAMMTNLRQEQEESLKRTGEKHEAEPCKRLKETVQAVQATKPVWSLEKLVVKGHNVLGSLADEDADLERPLSTMSKGQDVTRKNEIVRIADSDSEVETTKISRQAPSSSPNDSSNMPSFVMSDWSTRFLPTLYHVLFCSEKPFHEFSKGSELLKTVQMVVDIVHPHHSYVVTTESKLYLSAYDRLVEKRSDFGARALKIVEQVFRQAEYLDNAHVVSQYARWAMKGDGPALWRVPSPQGALSTDDDYVKPKDLFESRYMIDMLKQLIKKPIVNSRLVEYGYPKGAVALAAAGIERAFSTFESGQQVQASPFSWDSHGSIVADYMKNLKKLSERRWKSLLIAYGTMEEGQASSDKKQLDVGANLFIGSLDENVDRRLLYDTFSAFGMMATTAKIARDPQTGQSKGYRFVSYTDFESADAAIESMNGQFFMNKPITVQYVFKKDGKGSAMARLPNDFWQHGPGRTMPFRLPRNLPLLLTALHPPYRDLLAHTKGNSLVALTNSFTENHHYQSDHLPLKTGYPIGEASKTARHVVDPQSHLIELGLEYPKLT